MLEEPHTMQQVEKIVSQTAEVFHRTTDELMGRSRKRPIVEARHAAIWAVRQRYPSFSLELIGAALGGRHYSTVMHALAAVEARAARSARYQEQLDDVLARIAAHSRVSTSMPSRHLRRHQPGASSLDA